MKLMLPALAISLRRFRAIILSLALMLLPCLGWGSGVDGRVVNRSRNQSAASDEVILYRVEPSMVEMARTKTGRDGTFQFDLAANFPYLVAVIHQGVSYHTPTLRGTAPVEIAVYDSAHSILAARTESSTLFVEPDGQALKGTEFFVISNESLPPRTLTGASTYRFSLPEDAALDSTAVQPPGTLPLRTNAVPCDRKNGYCVAYPIRPGITRLRVMFHWNRPASAWIHLPQAAGVRNVAVIVPEPFQLQSRIPGLLEKRSSEGRSTKYVATELSSSRGLVFRLSDGSLRRGDQTPLEAAKTVELSPYLAATYSWPTTSLAARSATHPAARSFMISCLASLALLGMVAARSLSKGKA